MTDNKAHAAAKAQNAMSALAILAEHPVDEVCKLSVASGLTKGAIYLQSTVVIGCSLGSSGDKPMESLDKLLSLPDASIAFCADALPSDLERISLPIAAIFAERSSTAALKPSIGSVDTQEITPEELEELAKAATDFEFVIKRQEKLDETARKQFETEQPVHAGDDTETLSPEKRADLEFASRLVDKEAFAKSHRNISAEPEKIDLESLKSIVPLDEKPFEETDVPIDEGEVGLTEEQRTTLGLASQMRDEIAFAASNEKLKQQELAIAEHEKWILEEAARQLTAEEAKVQFEADGALPIDKDEIVETKLTPEELSARTEELDSIPPPPLESATVHDGDRRSLLPGAERLGIREREDLGLINRDVDEIANTSSVARIRRAMADWQKYSGPVILVSLCVALVTVPAAMKAAMYKNADQSIASQQVNAIVEEETANSIAYASQDEAPQTSSGGGPGGSSGPVGAPSAIGEQTGGAADSGSELAEADSLLSRGFEAAAADKYETYLAAHPMSVSGRLALIKLYIRSHKRAQARSHAIWGYKSNLPPEQRQQFYELFKQCLTD